MTPSQLEQDALNPEANVETADPWFEPEASSPATAAQPEGPRVSVFDVLMMLARQRMVILGTTVLFTLIAVVYAVTTPRMYDSTVTILPPAQMSTRGVGASMQDLTAALSSAEGFSFKSAEDFWTAVLKGRTISERVVTRASLMQAYHARLMSQAINVLKSRTTFDIDKAGLVSVSVRDRDPKRAAEIANDYILAMHDTMSDMAVADAQQRRIFFNQQVEDERGKLARAEDDLLQVQHKTGVIALGGQTEEAIQQIGSLRAQITSAKVQLQAMHAVATDQNPDVQRLQSQIAADEAALAQAQTQQGKAKVGDISASDVPQATLDYIAAAREVRYHEALYDALGKQVEAARLDEERSAPLVQIVDPAVPEDHPAGMGRVTLVMLGFVFGVLFGLVFATVRHFYQRLNANPAGRQKMMQLKAALLGQQPTTEGKPRA
jgi:uncharacterized protein involved in exopolysaccharide biosynthesis